MGPDDVEYQRFRRWIDGAIHELPAGVLWGSNGATQQECHEMVVGLNEFANLCRRLGLDDHRVYIEECRWHFEHYAHFLGRRRHFGSYQSYVRERGGPLRIELPDR